MSISNNVNRIDIIRWCVDKGFWQQVLTLCTEWLPELIVDYKIYYTNDSQIRFDAKVRGQKYRNWKQNLITDYFNLKPVEEQKFTSDVIRVFFDFVRTLSNNLMDKKNNDVTFSKVIEQFKNFGNLSLFFKEYEQFLNDYPDCDTVRKFIEKKYTKSVVNAFTNEYPILKEVLQKIFEIYKSNNLYNKKFLDFLDTVPRYDFLKYLFARDENNSLQFSPKQLKNIFSLKFNGELVKFVIETDNFQKDNKWDNRKDEYIKMLKEGITATDLETSDAMQILKDYYEIRAKRNGINHANRNTSEEITNLKNMIENCLQKLESCKKVS